MSDTIRSLQYGGMAASVTAMRPPGVGVALVIAVLVVNRSRNDSQTLCYNEARTDLSRRRQPNLILNIQESEDRLGI